MTRWQRVTFRPLAIEANFSLFRTDFRITESCRLKRTSGGHPVQPPAWSRLNGSGCSGHCPAELWASLVMEIPQPLLAAFSNIWPFEYFTICMVKSFLISNRNFPCSKLGFLPFLLLPCASEKSPALFSVPFPLVAEDNNKLGNFLRLNKTHSLASYDFVCAPATQNRSTLVLGYRFEHMAWKNMF